MTNDTTKIVFILSVLIFVLSFLAAMTYKMHLTFKTEQMLYSTCLESGGTPNYDDQQINCEKKQ